RRKPIINTSVMIIRHFLNHPTFLSAEELYFQLLDHQVRTSMTTVYNHLNRLQSSGVLISMQSNRTRKFAILNDQ
ncbi:MAG: transcriptional repressor, partial [Bacteroidota bacterium]